MPFEIVRNDITKMKVDAIVNTANEEPIYSSGTDTAIYKAAGEDLLLAERQKIGFMNEGEVAITSGFNLPSKYIIHAVSPCYIDGASGEEDKLRQCYRRSLNLAWQNNCKSIAFPLIATGSFGYPKEEGMSIAVEEIKADAGLDIGGTLIGMHLKKVAVPVRLENNKIGCATVLAARVRIICRW